MARQIYHIAYNGLDSEDKIDCLAQIRRNQNPPGSTCLDVEGLCKSKRSTREDAQADGEPLEPGHFVKVGKIEF